MAQLVEVKKHMGGTLMGDLQGEYFVLFPNIEFTFLGSSLKSFLVLESAHYLIGKWQFRKKKPFLIGNILYLPI